MTIPIEIVATILGVAATAVVAGCGFVYMKLSSLDARIARIETRLGIVEEEIDQ